MKFKYENQKLICQDVESLRRMFDLKNVKITGTSFLALLGKSKYHSPAFSLLKKITGFKVDIDPKHAKAGEQYEPVLIKKMMSEEIGVVNYNPINAHEVKYDYFKENKYFGGIPDLIVYRVQENVEIVDIKTTSIKKLDYENDPNKRKWAPFFNAQSAQENSPDYVFQLFLYSYLAREHKGMNVTQCSLYAGFLRDEDYPYFIDGNIKLKPVNPNMTTRYLKWPYTDDLHRKIGEYVNLGKQKIEKFLKDGIIDLPTSSLRLDFKIEENKNLLAHMQKNGFIMEQE